MPDIVTMFFVLGVLAGLVRSDLEVPRAAYDVLSLLLMLTIGLKGGIALHGNLVPELVIRLLAVMTLGFLIPLVLYPVMRRLVGLNIADSASFIAHYGSVSAGTFAVALAYTQTHALATGGEVTLYLVLLELPAILTGMVLYALFSRGARSTEQHSIGTIVAESFTNRSVILLVGGVIIGWMYGPQQGQEVTGLLMGAFTVVLALFLLDMGLTAAEALRSVRRRHWRVLTFALLAPMVLAWPGLLLGLLLDLPIGSTLILASLTASASYIAAPVAVRGAIPEADSGMAMLAALGVTFPFNVLVGIPLYAAWLQWLL
ncbi:sodium-dependent bicarbonate transport family permease [Natronospirillum operosum]|uniref:Sodium-dependent bicarbonate transport family permease n=1 Tax=Natronospirillum operosum TaxID=2759953 RepID=A0A4Z0WDW8_9GAMM|nr:sodium-dependent bicarbonate transport family permease [Natronospirillum operosum]TGG93356.1 sodium-dependent bicarbonate transport family permease [Natronospirillum operosum]